MHMVDLLIHSHVHPGTAYRWHGECRHRTRLYSYCAGSRPAAGVRVFEPQPRVPDLRYQVWPSIPPQISIVECIELCCGTVRRWCRFPPTRAQSKKTPQTLHTSNQLSPAPRSLTGGPGRSGVQHGGRQYTTCTCQHRIPEQSSFYISVILYA